MIPEMTVDLSKYSDEELQPQPKQSKFSSFFSGLVHRSQTVPLKRKSDGEEDSSASPRHLSPAATASNLYPHQNHATTSLHKNYAAKYNGDARISSHLSKHPSTPSPSPAAQTQNENQKQSKGFAIVIPSPSRQLKKEIEESDWLSGTRPVTGLSERIYPTDAYERRATKGSYPTASKKKATTSHRRAVPLHISPPDEPVLLKSGAERVRRQLRRSLMDKLAKVQGPPVTLAPDDERHLVGFAANFEFVEEYKLGQGVSPVPEVFNGGCDCYPVCDPAKCSCLSKEEDSEDNIVPYQKDDSGMLVLSPEFLKRTSMIFECSSRCGCSGRCWNHVVQNGRTVPFEIFHTGNRGFGLCSPTPIRAGQFIDRYLGEVITRDRADVREDIALANHGHSYLFGLDFLADDESMYVVDGQKFGSATRFMNHSCNPNCRIFLVSRNHGDDRLYDLAFFAVRDIPAGTELTFDYNPGAAAGGSGQRKNAGSGSNAAGAAGDAGKKSKETDPDAVRCLCGEKNCRGQLWPSKRKGIK